MFSRPSNDRQRRWWRAGAFAWLAVVLWVLAHQVQFWREDRVSFDILALLPADEQMPELDIATRRLADSMSRQVVVMLGSRHWSETAKAAEHFRQSIRESGSGLQEVATADAATLLDTVEFYRPWRDRLLTPAQRQTLETTPGETLNSQAMALLLQPGAGIRLSSWTADPLGLWEQWWTERAAESPARPRDSLLWLHADKREWAVLFYDTPESAFSLTGEPVYGQALQQAWQQASKHAPDLQWLRGGVPLHAEAGATQANQEINLIGWGSLAGVIALAWVAFRSARAIALVAASLLIACAVALSATAWVFGEVHLITLIFGASLVGVAEDYGIHYFANRQGHPGIAPQPLMARLLPTLLVALVTSVFAYLALGVASFPGLRQMAFFSAVGLVAAMITVVAWFPFLDRGTVKQSPVGTWLGSTLGQLPRLTRHSPFSWLFIGLMIFCMVWAFTRSNIQDDIRQLQSSPPELVADQAQIGRLLKLPSPAQFYLVQGPNAEVVLQREERLAEALDTLVARKLLGGYSAVSSWVPSIATQNRSAALSAQAEQGVLNSVSALQGEQLERPAYDAPPLTVNEWLEQPGASFGRAMWLGQVGDSVMSVVMLRGLTSTAALPELAAVAQSHDGVRWVDRPAELSSLLQRYRGSMTGLLLAGHLVVFAIVSWRFGRPAWRAWVPTVLASFATAALLSWMGEPWQLFNVLALALLLGVGVDYGIFLLEHDNEPSAWLAVLIGAGSTWLSFGLLGLSGVPALRAFGLTLMIGLVLVLVFASLLRTATGSRPSSPHTTPAST